MIAKSTSLLVAPSKPESEPPGIAQHREVTSINLSTTADLEAVAECNREIRTLLSKKDSYSLQRLYKLLDNAFFDGQIAKAARIIQCKSEISAVAGIGGRLRYDGQGSIIICLPKRGEKSVQEVMTILLREMATINFWKVDSCSCEDCRCAQRALKICDFLAYLSEINAMANFHLRGFRDQWKIESGGFSVLKDIIKVLQDAKQVDWEFAGLFEMAKPTPEVTLRAEACLDKQDTAPEIASPVEGHVEAQDVTPGVTSLVEEALEKQDTTPAATSLDEEPLEKQDATPEVTSLVEEPPE